MPDPIYIHHLALTTPLGDLPSAILSRLATGWRGALQPSESLPQRGPVPVGAVVANLPPLPPPWSRFLSRNNQLLYHAFRQQEAAYRSAIQAVGPDRVAIVLGTSTSGVAQTEQALAHLAAQGSLPEDFDYRRQEIGNGAAFLQTLTGVSGPVYGLSTACSSSAKAFGSAMGLIQAGLADAALVGGADSLCALTLNGFASLEALSAEPSRPFEAQRKGLNIGEGAALFWLSKSPSPLRLLACGESSDAHHMSAPQPQGHGAADAMRAALGQAGLEPGQIGYLNLHGTATLLNDQMESRAVAEVFGAPGPPCSSTKALTGHLLGAAGAVEAAFCCLLLSQESPSLPPQNFVEGPDPALPVLNWVQPGQSTLGLRYLMSNSFAFGGSNCSLIFGKEG
ncbi:MAG: beta-ketoacyl-[acyl-carrier-protein] synthase family protein [bacterium]|nr:beta-ketoacyl-[acyl-carrier-protein] synthase family protein [bacterium]